MGDEGDLLFTLDSSSADFDYEGPFHSCDSYYHAHGPIFPIDPDVETARKTDHSDVDASSFGISILSCDKFCVATGSHYIEAFTKERDGDIVDDIDDLRNGLLVNPMLYRFLGRDAAILQTPNFIMKTTDVIPRTAPGDARWTLHVFDELTAEDPEHNVVPAGQAIRIPGERKAWPHTDFLMQVRSIGPTRSIQKRSRAATR
ncbi:hypothetical protein ARMSODRAFT_1089885 [Armillaria solidipes]|uniref:HNH nuclease domain-containing protein n=1 Tax=Armillaria solidipes TaxID=1076256 RepID=A0A2H3AQZ9_9AGAR|nr:hypothetical protein ARMSODRAFT_1089885 [Armillaria solidipes]